MDLHSYSVHLTMHAYTHTMHTQSTIPAHTQTFTRMCPCIHMHVHIHAHMHISSFITNAKKSTNTQTHTRQICNYAAHMHTQACAQAHGIHMHECIHVHTFKHILYMHAYSQTVTYALIFVLLIYTFAD